MLDHNNLNSIINRGVAEIIVKDEFVSLLQKGKPLRLKMGFDPSRPDIHLGYVVALRKLRALQELGHRVILIVGDWTAQIGDPSGQSATRVMISHEEVLANAETYMEQFFKVVDKERTDTVFQSEWFGKFKLEDVINLTSKFTVAQFLERDDFSIRFKSNRPIALTEFLYPLLQAYDSVVIESDVEFGGTDQKFNLLVGRELQAMMGQRPQQCFLNPLLIGTDGVRKMSQSFDNYIGLEDLPNDMFGKLMSIADNLIINYFEYLTDVADSELNEMTKAIEEETVNPMDLKKQLSLNITSQFHGSEKALSAQSNFEKVVQRRLMPDDMPEMGFH
ncbi:tyrosine--tRNA ligase, partial [SAR202 cluster bacterium AC-409-J13_OGT_754m]|nr:tyrosine--tRNA ligase [SAR202 cluster bacterium AC-409-J13_OGT_754m]